MKKKKDEEEEEEIGCEKVNKIRLKEKRQE